MKLKFVKHFFLLALVLIFPMEIFSKDWVGDLEDIREKGIIRHLGVPYAKFVTGAGDGMSVDIVKGFAAEIGVEYRFVKTSFQKIIPELTGVDPASGKKERVKGDIIATGFTILPWRRDMVRFSKEIFPTQVWLVAKAESEIKPIVPGADIDIDILNVKKKLDGISLLGVSGTCLDPTLYDLKKSGAKIKIFNGSVNDLAPAVINNEAETGLLDVADTLIALRKWPGRIKVIGPVGPGQKMAAAFRETSSKLVEEYNRYLDKICKSGEFVDIVKRYYPDVFIYYPDFFSECLKERAQK